MTRTLRDQSCKLDHAGGNPVVGSTIEQIICQVVELSLDRNTGDSVRDIYSVMMDISIDLMKLYVQIREQEIPG